MSLIMNRRTLIVSTAALAFAAPQLARASEVEVQMLNKHPEDKKKRMIFEPLITVVQPGDTVNFVAVDKGHNSEAIKGMVPDGVEIWKGKISKDIAVTFDKPGLYGYKCTPHASIGMVGLVICEGEGKLDNLEAAKGVKQRGKAKKVFREIWAQAEADGLLA
ncbi:MAG: pseudoazurin [Pseudomonadota bacterium]